MFSLTNCKLDDAFFRQVLLQSFKDVTDEVCVVENIVPQEVDVFCDKGWAVTTSVALSVVACQCWSCA